MFCSSFFYLLFVHNWYTHICFRIWPRRQGINSWWCLQFWDPTVRDVHSEKTNCWNLQRRIKLKQICLSRVDENEVLKVADRRLIDNYQYSTQSSGIDDHSSGIGSNTHSIRKAEECIAGVIRVGLCCTAQEPKDRWSMREAITKLQAIKHSMLALWSKPQAWMHSL